MSRSNAWPFETYVGRFSFWVSALIGGCSFGVLLGLLSVETHVSGDERRHGVRTHHGASEVRILLDRVDLLPAVRRTPQHQRPRLPAVATHRLGPGEPVGAVAADRERALGARGDAGGVRRGVVVLEQAVQASLDVRDELGAPLLLLDGVAGAE